MPREHAVKEIVQYSRSRGMHISFSLDDRRLRER